MAGPVAEGYKKLGVPIHVVPVGAPGSVGDVAIQDVVVPREARSGTKLPVRVVVRSLGFTDERAEIVVRSLSDPRKKPLASLPITLNDGEIVRDLVIDSDQARGPLVVEVPRSTARRSPRTTASRSRSRTRHPKVRVIYMEGSVSTEMRFVHDALVEDPNIECLNIGLDTVQPERQRLQRIDHPQLGYPATREGVVLLRCRDLQRHRRSAHFPSSSPGPSSWSASAGAASS